MLPTMAGMFVLLFLLGMVVAILIMEHRLSRIQKSTKENADLLRKCLQQEIALTEVMRGVHTTLDSRIPLPEKLLRK